MLMDYVQRGGPVMYPLLACSLVAFTVVTERLLFWMRMRQAQAPDQIARCLHLAQEGRYEEATELARSSADPILHVLAHGLANRDGTPTLAMEKQAKDVMNQMSQYLTVLDTTITIAPLLGIYGTLTGIIRAFDSLSAGGFPDPRLVGAGIAEALITTIAGLTIAIPGIIFYNHFTHRAERVSQELEQHATALELVLKRCSQHEQTTLALS